MIFDEEQHLMHYGILRKSGRYPWGSGDTESQRNRSFLDTIEDLRKQGLSDTEICKGFSTDDNPFTTTMMRAAIAIASNQQRQENINQALRLADRGWGPTAIGERMGASESTVRGWLAPGAADKASVLTNVSNILMKRVDEDGIIDVGSGTEFQLDISDTKMRTAVAIAQEKGYVVHTIPVRTTIGNETKVKVLTPPGTTWGEAARNISNVKQINVMNDDGGRPTGNLGIQFPMSLNSKRLAVRYAEHGGAEADGVIYVRRGVKDISIGSNQYAQVRILVDGSHYLKGMAMYKDDLPDGVDLMFNTNKSNTGNKLDALKPVKTDPETGKVDKDNPFGAQLKRQIIEKGEDGSEKLTSVMNIVRDEGDWEKWTRALSSQILSKQSPELAKQQLDMTYEHRKQEFDEITSLTNPAVRKKLLESFADGSDAAAVNLKAATLPGSAYHVILPISSSKPTEVYAPNYRNGERVALIRSPHGGTFEIPELTVNNKNAEARRLIGSGARDAVGIHHQVAERLSGADFDGDFVIVVPNDKGHIKSTPALEGLKDFDPKRSFPPYDGMPTIDGGTWNAKENKVEYGTKKDGTPRKPTSRSQNEMGIVTNLIADMSIRGANNQEKAQAVRHSMVVIDAEKHNLDWKASYEANGIKQLKQKYQPRTDGKGGGGASTIVTRSTSEKRVDERRLRRASEGGPIDPDTGRLVYVPTNRTYTDKAGNVHKYTTKTTKGAESTDAHRDLSSGQPIEMVYADYANKTKALANAARKEYLSTKTIPYSKSAKAAYAPEVARLNAALNLAKKNRPLERQAQALASAVVSQKRRANPDMDPADVKKIRNQALVEMRHRTGADKTDIIISPKEWDAIQAGAISNHKLEEILDKADLDVVKKHATPVDQLLMTSTKRTRAMSMAKLGYTQAEIAQALGVSLTTLKNSIDAG